MKGVPWETAGGFARGGAVFNGGEAKIVSTTVSSNGVTGGNGTAYEGLGQPDGGDGSGGGVFNNGTLELSRCTLDANCSQGGNGVCPWNAYGTGGRGAGGACASVDGQLRVLNSTLSGNSALGGQGGSPLPLYTTTAGSGGDGVGGAVYSTNSLLRVTNSTIVANLATGGVGGAWEDYYSHTSGTGPTGKALTGGIRFEGSGSFSLYNSILAQNTAGDVFGNFTGTPNLIGGDPRLGSLADNGGPTWTMPLLAGSPAIDAGDNAAAPVTDQRGRARPYGTACDIGAFESCPPYSIRGVVSGPVRSAEVPITIGSNSLPTVNGGNYSLLGVDSGTYLVTPQGMDFLFWPPSRSVTVGPDQVNVNFRTYHWNTLNLDDLVNDTAHLVFAGTNDVPRRLLASTNLIQWQPVRTNLPGPEKCWEITLPVGGQRMQFYRVLSP